VKLIDVWGEAILSAADLVLDHYAAFARDLCDRPEELLTLTKLPIMRLIVDPNQQSLTDKRANALGLGLWRLLIMMRPMNRDRVAEGRREHYLWRMA
jgi:hypothetical protein